MTIERTVLVAAWILSLAGAAFLLIRGKAREAIVPFLFMQALTWINTVALTSFGFIRHPVREFPRATDSNFTIEYFFLPTVNAFFNIYFPCRGTMWRKLLYFFGFITGITVCLTSVERYTGLLEYTRYAWYWNMAVMAVEFAASRWYFQWFFRKGKGESGVRL